MERLNSLDQVFLALERADAAWNVGALAVFAGVPPGLDELRAFFEERLQRVARCRQRLRIPRGPLGRARWIDDVDFELARHVGSVALTDASVDELDAWVLAQMSITLDRAHPLWAVTLVEGLGDGHWALLSRVHHCMLDGIAGSDLLSALLDETAEPLGTLSPAWVPEAEPSAWRVLGEDLSFHRRRARVHARALVRALGHPRASAAALGATLRAARDLWLPVRRHPSTLNSLLGRPSAWRRAELDRHALARVQSSRGVTLNDVALSLVTRGVRALLLARGETVQARHVTALVPVSRRHAEERGELHNLLANVHAELAVGLDDAGATLEDVARQLERLKASGEASATGLVMHVGDFLPRGLADTLSRAIVTRQKKVEVVVSNVPGPTRPLRLLGRDLLAAYPFAPTAGHVSLTVALWSYAEGLYVGVSATPEVAGDLEVFVHALVRGLDELAGPPGPSD